MTERDRAPLLLVTDLAHEDRGEDLFLAERLARDRDVAVVGPEIAAKLVAGGGHRLLLVRNAWPSRLHAGAFAFLEAEARAGRIAIHNPPSRTRGLREDKGYLVDAWRDLGRRAIPTWRDHAGAADALRGTPDSIFKPFDGCSGIGIATGHVSGFPTSGGIYQPRLAFRHEASLFYVDGLFAYALRTGDGPDAERWDLTPFEPSAEDLDWGRAIVDWNGQPYGIQRIDGLRLADGALLLNEVEDFMPFLSLEALGAAARDAAVERIAASVSRWLR